MLGLWSFMRFASRFPVAEVKGWVRCIKLGSSDCATCYGFKFCFFQTLCSLDCDIPYALAFSMLKLKLVWKLVEYYKAFCDSLSVITLGCRLFIEFAFVLTVSVYVGSIFSVLAAFSAVFISTVISIFLSALVFGILRLAYFKWASSFGLSD